MKIRPEDAERLWARMLVQESLLACWPWTGPKDKDGYGTSFTSGGAMIKPHRAAFELAVETIKSGNVPDHLCRNRSCCNPWHMEQVTIRENTIRGDSPAAINSVATHCKAGHEFTPGNTYLRNRPGGGRICRTCIFRRTRERRAMLKVDR